MCRCLRWCLRRASRVWSGCTHRRTRRCELQSKCSENLWALSTSYIRLGRLGRLGLSSALQPFPLLCSPSLYALPCSSHTHHTFPGPLIQSCSTCSARLMHLQNPKHVLCMPMLATTMQLRSETQLFSKDTAAPIGMVGAPKNKSYSVPNKPEDRQPQVGPLLNFLHVFACVNGCASHSWSSLFVVI